MEGHALSHGAITVVTAIATGKGAAFGIDLTTEAWVELDRSDQITVQMDGLEEEDSALARICAERMIDMFAPGKGLGGHVRTRSDIPVSRGLKSSSAAANAIISACAEALGAHLNPLEIARIGARCSMLAGVSVTGAFDDACAALLGGLVLTDNTQMTLVRREAMPSDLTIFIHVPDLKIRKQGLPLDRIRALAGVVEIAYAEAFAGRYSEAMIMNSLCYSAALGLDTEMMMKALQRGALAAGLSGTGPATAIIALRDNAQEVRAALGEGNIMQANIYNGDSMEEEQ